jgi:hypothetical protein
MRTLFLALAALPMSACNANGLTGNGAAADAIPGTGSGTSRTFAAKDFAGVDLVGPDDVVVTHGAAFSVRAEGDAKALDQLEITVRGGTLNVGRKREGLGWNSSTGKVTVHVTLPKLTSVSLTGAGNLTADKGEGDFEADLTGAGNLTIGALAAGSAEFDLTGAGDIKVAGSANRLEVDITGTGDFDGRGLTSGGAKIGVMGTGTVRSVVRGKADISIMGPGDVVLTGGAKCRVNATGPGEASCS